MMTLYVILLLIASVATYFAIRYHRILEFKDYEVTQINNIVKAQKYQIKNNVDIIDDARLMLNQLRVENEHLKKTIFQLKNNSN